VVKIINTKDLIAYLGPVGTFSEQAVNKYIEKFNKPLTPQAYNSIYEVIQAVAEEQVKEGVVPIENSVEGSVSTTLDMLAD